MEDGRVYALALFCSRIQSNCHLTVRNLLAYILLISVNMVKKTCKGCSALVVNPIVSDICEIASHPACIPRTGHPHSGNKFLTCTRPSSSGAAGLIGVASLKGLRHPEAAEITSKFAIFFVRNYGCEYDFIVICG